MTINREPRSYERTLMKMSDAEIEELTKYDSRIDPPARFIVVAAAHRMIASCPFLENVVRIRSKEWLLKQGIPWEEKGANFVDERGRPIKVKPLDEKARDQGLDVNGNPSL